VRERGEDHAARLERRKQTPVQYKTSRRRLERHRQRRYPRPHIPKRKWKRDVRVLDRLAMARDAGPDVIDRALEPQQGKARMAEQPQHGRAQKAEDEPIAAAHLWRQLAVLGAGAMVSGAEDHRRELAHVVDVERSPSGQAHFDRAAGPRMNAGQARRQGHCVVGDQHIARPQKIGEPLARRMAQAPGRIDHQQPGG
jgi:hypothetical protein